MQVMELEYSSNANRLGEVRQGSLSVLREEVVVGLLGKENRVFNMKRTMVL